MKVVLQLLFLLGLSFAFSTMSYAQKNQTEQQVQPVAVGDRAPDFELDSFDKTTVVLSERLRRGSGDHHGRFT